MIVRGMELNRSSVFLNEIDNSTWIRRRTTLEKGLMMALILTSAGILGFFINMCGVLDNPNTCDSPNCVLVAGQILTQIDKDVDPCDDFFRFACGKLVNVTPSEHHPKQLLQNKIEKQLQNLLEEPIDQKGHALLNYEKAFYQACVADKNGSKSLETLKEIFHAFGGWPVVVGNSWDESKFDWLQWIPKFHKYGLNHMQVLRYFLHFDETYTKRIIKIVPPYLVSYYGLNHEMRKQIVIDVVILFGAEEEAAHREMTEVMDFMWTMDKIKEDYINYTSATIRYSVSEFQKVHKEFDWWQYFNLLTQPAYTIKGDDYFSISHADCVNAILDLVKKTPKRTIANYMFWYATDELLPVLSSDMIDIYNIQQCVWAYPKTRPQMCKELMHNPWSSFVAYGRKYLTKQAHKRASDIMRRVKREFQALFAATTWMSEENKLNATQRLNTMTEIIGMGNNTMDYSHYDNMFKDKLKPQNGFLKMYLNLTSAINSVDMEASPTDRWVHDFVYFNYIIDAEILYIRSENAIILPTGALQDWYYDEERPMYVNFATFGKKIGATLANAGIGVHTLEYYEVEWLNETRKGFEAATNCISKKNEEDDPVTKYYDYKKLEVGQITGLKVAYNAYQEWIKANGEELPPKGTGYTSAQMFWISALTDACYKDDYSFMLYVHNEPLKQNPNFASDFHCPRDSKMNPSTRCHIL